MADTKTVTLDFADWRYDEWTYAVDGESFVIHKGGTEVPANKADAIVKASETTEAKVHKV